MFPDDKIPEILADENVDSRIIRYLRNNQFSVISISESCPGISDREVIDLAQNNAAILLTEDSDFGELVFSYKYRNVGIIYLRYVTGNLPQILENLVQSINKYKSSLYSKFTVIAPNKIRIRDL